MKGAIVTGASRGLGLALSQQLLEQGYQVVGMARHASPAIQTLSKLWPDAFRFLTVNLTDSRGLHGVMAEALEWLHNATEQLLLINNAGVVTPIATAGYYPAEQVAEAIAVNLTAPMLLTDAFLQLSEELSTDRRLLNVSSGAAIKVYPGWGVYGSTKAGLDHFCRHVAAEQQQQVNPARVVALYPGVVDTEMQTRIRASDPAQFPNKPRFDALKREGGLSQPEDAASAIIGYLLSPQFGDAPVVDLRNL